MLRIHEIKLKLGADKSEIPAALVQKLGKKDLQLGSWTIVKESLDARDKGDLKMVYSVDFEVAAVGAEKPGNSTAGETPEQELLARLGDQCSRLKLSEAPDMTYHFAIQPVPEGAVDAEISLATAWKNPVVVGFGPCGMFAALLLAQMGLRPLVLERGCAMDKRTEIVEQFWKDGVLDPETNVQFGEGGAGAFSDGKLTTQIKDPRVRKVLMELVKAGGSEELMYQQKPHIGTDVLRHVVVAIRQEIIRLGGQVRFESKVTGISLKNGVISGLVVNGTETIESDHVVLALGHSARDTMAILYEEGVKMAQKPFSMGVRIEHPQHVINGSQYGKEYEKYKSQSGKPLLGAADYKLSHHCGNGRGVYTFCMCPGGRIIAAASEPGQVVTNGMSYHSRDLENANSGLLVDVRTEDYESEHPLAGIEFQRKYEKLAYELGGSDYRAPVQRVGDFLKGQSTKPAAGQRNSVKPSYVPGVSWSDLSKCLPAFVAESIREALPYLGRKLRGFDHPDALMTAIESRSSSPVRILRDDQLQSSIQGLYPGGEGAGYAGGITSAAVDGIRIAEEIAKDLAADTK